MKALFACGGTGGHINPALAVAKMLRSRHPEAAILFAGARRGMEEKLVPAEGFALEMVDVEGFSRKLSGIGQNMRAVGKVLKSLSWANNLLDEFKPDIVVGTGGYACFPVLYAAAKRKIPTLIHESNAYPGLVTRVLSRYVNSTLVNFEATCEYLKKSKNVKVSGMPIREAMLYQDATSARRELGIDGKPLVVSFWGSLGARDMNLVIAEFIKMESKENDFYHIHATGKFGYEWMPQYVESLGVNLSEHPMIDLREYIHDMPRVMAAADLVICRGGASTISEIAALGKPAIIVPSPNVAANHQEKNAGVLHDVGGAIKISESEITPELLYNTARSLVFDKDRLAKMKAALSDVAVLDGCERIYREIMTLCREK